MKKIIWTKQSKLDYFDNIEYLEKEWTLNEVHSFIDKVDDLIELLTKGNITFKPTKYNDTFQIPVTKQITLFYKTSGNSNIELLSFWNTYQNPEKLKL